MIQHTRSVCLTPTTNRFHKLFLASVSKFAVFSNNCTLPISNDSVRCVFNAERFDLDQNIQHGTRATTLGNQKCAKGTHFYNNLQDIGISGIGKCFTLIGSSKSTHRRRIGTTFLSVPQSPLPFLSTSTSSSSLPESFRSIFYNDHPNTPHRSVHTSSIMAKSKFEYVRQFETDDPCLPNCWLVVRIDGKAFHRFTDNHHYMKPNDDRGLGLMTRAAQNVMAEFNEIVLAYGQSDEYSFVFHKNCKLYNRRASKIMTNVVSLFASSFTLYWSRFFNTQELQYPASFDARVVLYPSDDNIKDYLSWRQADCHINNLYNTCFWKLVQEKGLSPAGAQERLKGTLSSDKNEILYSEFNTNYNSLPELYRKGTVLIRPRDVESANDVSSGQLNNSAGYTGSSHKTKGKGQKPASVVLHCDIIGKQFWEEHPYVLASKRPV